MPPPTLNWQLRGSTLAADLGFFRVLRRSAEHPTSRKQYVFSVIDCADWVNVVALTRDERLVLVRQFRAGVERVTLEIPGGAVDPGETPLSAAARELREETGYSAPLWQSLGLVEPNPALQTNRCYSYLALQAARTQPTDFDESEHIAVQETPLSSMDELLRDGSITHALVHCALSAFYRCAGGWKAPTT